MSHSQRRTPVQPAGHTHGHACLHPSCVAHAAHQTAQRAAGMVQVPAPAPQPQTATQGRRFKISKNWVIGILIFLLVGAGGSLSDKDNEINDLKAKISHSHSAPAKVNTPSVTDAIKLCKTINAKGDLAECVIKVLGH